MPLFKHLPTAFPIYDNINKQTRFKAKDATYFPHLISPNNCVLPFQFRCNEDNVYPSSWKLLDLDGNLVSDLTSQVYDINARNLNGFDYFWFASTNDMVIGDPATLKMKPGCYYLEFEFPSGNKYYSETFRVPQDSFSTNDLIQTKYVRIEWKNFGSIEPIFYPNEIVSAPEFYNLIYLDSRITSSEPEIEEEVISDGNNVDVPIYQKAVIKYRLEAIVADYLKIALYTMILHDSRFLVTEGGLEIGEMENLSVESTVEEGGFCSTVSILFEDNILLASKACPDNFIQTTCPIQPTDEALNLRKDSFVDGSGRFRIKANFTSGFYGAELWLIIEGASEDLYLGISSKNQLSDIGGGYVLNPIPDQTGIYVKPLAFGCSYEPSNVLSLL